MFVIHACDYITRLHHTHHHPLVLERPSKPIRVPFKRKLRTLIVKVRQPKRTCNGPEIGANHDEAATILAQPWQESCRSTRNSHEVSIENTPGNRNWCKLC